MSNQEVFLPINGQMLKDQRDPFDKWEAMYNSWNRLVSIKEGTHF